MDKWTTIAVIGFIFGMFSPVIVSEYSKGQCRIEAIKAQMPAADIIKLCGK
jgi:hypothetical protein